MPLRWGMLALGIGIALPAAGCRDRDKPPPDDAIAPTDVTDGADFDASIDGGSVSAVLSSKSIWTQHNDNARTGAILTETVLDTSNVNTDSFGLLFFRPVQGQIYAQPLYLPSQRMPDGRTHNVVYVATTHNDVYAFDADDPDASDALWRANLGPSVPFEDLSEAGLCLDLQPEVGITATPVIDLRTGTLYVEAKTKEDGRYVHRLHALDVRTGAPKFGSPVEIRPVIAGTGMGSEGGMLPWDPLRQHVRPALLLDRGQIYLASASHCDRQPYHGWVLAYDAATLRQTAAWMTTPDSSAGGIWQSGQGLAADEDGDVYFISGDGTFDPERTPIQLGNAFVRLRLQGHGFQLIDWFVPHNWQDLNDRDFDLGSTGVLLLPGTRLLLGGSKEGMIYVLDRDRMGHCCVPDDAQIAQSFLAGVNRDWSNIHGTPVYWNGPGGPFVYVWPEEQQLEAFRFDGTRFDPTPSSHSETRAPDGMPGGILSVSAHGDRAGSGVVWASLPLQGSALHRIVPGVLRAFDAADVGRELWNSELDPARDRVGMFAKFVPPTIAGGRVYLATFSDRLNVYGLRP